MSHIDRWIALAVVVALLVTGVTVGLLLGRVLWYQPVEAVTEAPAAPEWHDDGSLTLARLPTDKPEFPAPSAPKRGKLIRTAEVTVKPKPAPAGSLEPCEPVKLRLDWHEQPDGIRSSVWANGEILDGVDIPYQPINLRRDPVWAVGVERRDGNVAMAVDGDAGRLRVGVSIGEDTQAVRVLFRF